MVLPESLDEAIETISRLEMKIATQQDAISTYEALSEEEELDNESKVYEVQALIVHHKSQLDGDFALGEVSGQTKDYFLERVNQYLKILNG